MARNIFINIFIILIGLFLIGCSQKETKIVPQYIKVPCKYPKLKIYKDKQLKLHIKIKDNKVCIKEWDTCIPKDKFKELINYIKYKEEIIKKYQSEIEIYNKKIKE